ncbi:MAG: M16 family metallopeptidase [Syntrophales bacterium]
MIMMKDSPRSRSSWIFVLIVWAILSMPFYPAFPAGDVYAAQPESKPFAVPAYEKIMLKNGLSVYLMEHHKVPLIYASFIVHAGAVADGDKSGLAYLTAESLLAGTQKHSKEQIEERLEFLGVNYSVYAGLETAGIDMSFMKTDQNEVFPILKDVIQNAAFPPSAFENRKKRLLLELVQAKEQPSLVIYTYFKKFLFGNHSYGNPIYGTRASVEKISSNDAKAFYRAHYRPEKSALVIVGDFQTDRMKRDLQAYFESWQPRGKPLPSELGSLPVFNRSRVLLVDKDDALETRFSFGGLGLPRSHPDYVAVQVVSTILGGRFTSWLNDALRVEAGLTYGANSQFETFKKAGTFSISSFTQTENTAAALDLALVVYQRLHAQGVDEKTLASAKQYLIGQFPPLYETPDSLVSLLAAMFVYGIDESFVNDFQKHVESVTIESVKGIVSKYFPRENLQFVLIGKASAIREEIRKYGELYEKDIKSDGF